FGSFIGFSFTFGVVLQINFIADGQTAAQASLHAAQIAFLGPLLGSLARAVGGRLADRIGGGPVTLAAFIGMFCAAGLLAGIGTLGDHSPGATLIGSVIGFVALFLVSGIGNGSVYKMIPSIFEARSHALKINESERRNWSREMSGALIGFAGAVGALGGVGINLALRQSYLAGESTTPFSTAYWIFLVCYVGAGALTWLRYVRRPAATTRVSACETEVTAAELAYV
ncbi:MAG TPA: MFS transporter, partial [Mycobacterium sp.]|nr:MFS transporter [Mycobacterium sp.]